MLETMNGHSTMDEHQALPSTDGMDRCIENCLNCHRVCLGEMTNHCLEAGGPHVAPRHMKLMLDCTQICQAAADFMIRASAFHTAICDTCATICEACVKSCQDVGDMDACVEACRKCADSCRQMAGVAFNAEERNAFVI